MEKVTLLDLRPTQMATGFLEIKDKIRRLSRMRKKKLKLEISQNPLDVVENPQGRYYIIDGHHRAFAYWVIGVKKVPVKVKYRFPKKTQYREFWRKMMREHWVHPYNESGDGPIDFIYLAQDIRGVGNDPYRSLAWLVRESGGYEQTDVTFADFAWAQFFREKKLLHHHYAPRFKETEPIALRLARSRAASRLPGYKK